MSTKILIIENDFKHFEILYDKLEEHINGSIFPIKSIDKKGVVNKIEWSELLTNIEQFVNPEIKEMAFENILKKYENITLFIVDIALLNNNDQIGLKFISYLENNYKNDYEYIIISNGSRITNFKSLKYGADFFDKHFVDKDYEGLDLFGAKVIELIIKIYKLK